MENSEKILVETDYDNVVLIDPNKVILNDGSVIERAIKQENLVMYANLEAVLIPRTKLNIGQSLDETTVRPVTVATNNFAKINFQNPGGKGEFTTAWSDEITGKGSTEKKGTNQVRQSIDMNSQFFIKQGIDNLQDTETLGIQMIDIDNNASHTPTITMELVDVGGRTLFEKGDNSAYAAFFNLPYPIFYLTLKGYFGKAIRYQLILSRFTASLDPAMGNFRIKLIFYSYKYTILSDMSLKSLFALPNMYNTTYTLSEGQQGNTDVTTTKDVVVSRGFRKIKEMYSEYKSKNLISMDFPEISLAQLIHKLDFFERNILAQIPPEDVVVFSNINDYIKVLKDFQSSISINRKDSWFGKYIDQNIYYVGNPDENTRIFRFKKEIESSQQKIQDAISELEKLIAEFNEKLNSNATLGLGGTNSVVEANFTINDILKENLTSNDIDWCKTYKRRFSNNEINPTKCREKVTEQYGNLSNIIFIDENDDIVKTKTFVFNGKDSFNDKIGQINTKVKKIEGEIENILSEKLSKKLQELNGLGFQPTIRNIFAVIFASIEGFFRLMDDVHKEAFEERNNRVRINTILGDNIANVTPEGNGYVDMTNPENTTNGKIQIYPWPKFMVKKEDDKGATKYEMTYVADPSIEGITQGNNYSIWPEVYFLEEFIKGSLQRDVAFNLTDTQPNSDNSVNRLSLNAVEFPTTNQSYIAKEEVKFFYEIIERLLVTASLTKLNRLSTNKEDIFQSIAEIETYNILESLSNDNPFLIEKLKSLNLGSYTTFNDFLRAISNEGIGESWQLYIRGEYVTNYLKQLIETDYSILPYESIINGPSPNHDIVTLEKLKNLVITSNVNTSTFTDVLPFTDLDWCRNNLSNGIGINNSSQVFETDKVIGFNTVKKHITNFNVEDSNDVKRPFVNFSFNTVITPNISNDANSIRSFYEGHYNQEQFLLPTEGKLIYDRVDQTQIGNQQTVSMLNTPFMLNSIQLGIEKAKTGNTYPFTEAAYLFLNSLPLATLKEKYKTLTGGEVANDLDYIFATFKKFGAVHKLPYSWILKYGSIWYRYKKKIEENIDILDIVWNNVNAVNNFDPITNSSLKTYNLFLNNVITPITFQSTTTNLGFDITKMNLGFYPKSISDINYLITGEDYFTDYSDVEIQGKINTNLFIGKIDDVKINQIPGFDLLNPSRSLNMNFWYSLIKVDDKFIIPPSFGSKINQIKYECFTTTSTSTESLVLREEVVNNNAIFNGSSRLFWSAPNYGYFNIDYFVKPQYDEYLKEIYVAEGMKQDSFNLSNQYSKIDELIPTFKKEILDSFEQEFLNFCTSEFNIPEENRVGNLVIKNFQRLFSELLTIDAFTISSDTTSNEIIDKVWNAQTNKIGETVKSFIDYNILFKYGNPSNFNRKVFNSLSTKTIVDPIVFTPYTFNTVPSTIPNSITLTNSKNSNPDAWKAMLSYVGDSTVLGLTYTDSGSYYTDFFIDMNIGFTEENIKKLYPLIQIYGTQKKAGTINSIIFKDRIYEYLIDNIENFQANILTKIFNSLQKELPNVSSTLTEETALLEENSPNKLETWEHFKSFNDKWVAGNNYKEKTLFEDVLFLDRASRDLGNDIIIDIVDLKRYLKGKGGRVLDLISHVLEKNKFIMMPLPAFVNYWGVTTPSLLENPPIETSADFADDLFGTFMNVDFRNSSPKLVCIYTDVPSEHLDMKNNPQYPWRSDSFDLRRPDNSLRESLIGKKDWYFSNKCVAFNVDFGTRNQGMFKSFSLSQDNTQNTSETFQIQQDIAENAAGVGVAQQSQSLFNVYRSRSYTCTVIGMGNALIQPTMYFNLRHVPMFSGPYLILTVKHSIDSGDFTTQFTGVRVPIYSLPRVGNSLTAMNTSLYKEYFKKYKNRLLNSGDTLSYNVINIRNNVLTSDDVTPISDCEAPEVYNTYSSIDPTETSLSTKEIIDKIKTNVISDNADLQKKLRAIVFSVIYIYGGKPQEVKSWNNNYGGAPLENFEGPVTYSALKSYFTNKYICLADTLGGTYSYPTFNSPEDSIKFLRDKFNNQTVYIDTTDDEKLSESLLKNWIENWPKNTGNTYEDIKVKRKEFVDNLRIGFDASVKIMNSQNLFT